MRTQLRCAFAYLCITILLGILLRSAYVFTPFFNYQYLLHTHSHVAILGWIYTILTTWPHSFLEKKYQKKYRNLFLLTQITIVGMLLSFPFQGYGLFSILFSSLFLIMTYCYSYFLLKNTSSYTRHLPSFKFVRAGIFFLLLSSVGIWALPIIIVTLGKENNMYQEAIYFFLHFQYNGFIVSSLTAFWVQQLEQTISHKLLNRVFYGSCLGILGATFLSWTGFWQSEWLYVVGGIAVVIWFLSLLIISKLSFIKISKISFLLALFIGMYFLKTLFLFAGAIPHTVKYIFFNTDLIISYLHFVFLGVVTFGILYFFFQKIQISFPSWSVSLYMIAFIATEILIFYKGIATCIGLPLPANYFLLLFIFSNLYAVVLVWAKWIWKVK